MAENSNEVDPVEERKKLMDMDGHLLIKGGPGSGKTTIALQKAAHIIGQEKIQPRQKILFLSFARATISRVEERSQDLLDPPVRDGIQIDTYHGFFWSLLKTHGYLLFNRAHPIRLLAPPEEAVALADIIEKEKQAVKKKKMFYEEGLIGFDLFAPLAAKILSRSEAIREIYSDAYPVLILDEFQDTNSDEWKVIQLLGERSTVIALADLNQRIYEFRGASNERPVHFQNKFNPHVFDFENQNYRSNGTDILKFGNDLLRGTNRRKEYKDVSVHRYRSESSALPEFKFHLLERMQDIQESGIQDWSVAILVPSKRMMLRLSQYMEAEQDKNLLPKIEHEAALEPCGPSLAAELLGQLLEVASADIPDVRTKVIKNVISHIRGCRGGDGPTKKSAKTAEFLEKHIKDGQKARGHRQQAILTCVDGILKACNAMELTGDPAKDWLKVRSEAEKRQHDIPEIEKIVEDAKYLRLMRRGTFLSSRLSELWRSNRGTYAGAELAVHDSLVEEHFSMSKSVPRGVQVMTMHKSKGKQFTETIVFEGVHWGKYIRNPKDNRSVEQATILLRVAVTRAERHCSVFTPEFESCALL